MRHNRAFWLALSACVLLSCNRHHDAPSAREAGPVELVVLASAKLEKPLRAALSHPPVPVKLTTAPAGELSRRIAQGTHADLAILAEGPALSKLESAGKVVKGSPKPLVEDHLVVIGFPSSPIPLEQPGQLARIGAKDPPWRGRLLVLDPATRAGALTRSYLQQVQYEGKSVWASIAERRTNVSSVAEIGRKVATIKRMLGIVPAREAAALGSKVRIMLRFQGKDAPRLRYDAALVAKGHTREAKKLVDFLRAPARLVPFTKQGWQRAAKEGK